MAEGHVDLLFHLGGRPPTRVREGMLLFFSAATSLSHIESFFREAPGLIYDVRGQFMLKLLILLPRDFLGARGQQNVLIIPFLRDLLVQGGVGRPILFSLPLIYSPTHPHVPWGCGWINLARGVFCALFPLPFKSLPTTPDDLYEIANMHVYGISIQFFFRSSPLEKIPWIPNVMWNWGFFKLLWNSGGVMSGPGIGQPATSRLGCCLQSLCEIEFLEKSCRKSCRKSGRNWSKKILGRRRETSGNFSQWKNGQKFFKWNAKVCVGSFFKQLR